MVTDSVRFEVGSVQVMCNDPSLKVENMPPGKSGQLKSIFLVIKQNINYVEGIQKSCLIETVLLILEILNKKIITISKNLSGPVTKSSSVMQI